MSKLFFLSLLLWGMILMISCKGSRIAISDSAGISAVEPDRMVSIPAENNTVVVVEQEAISQLEEKLNIDYQIFTNKALMHINRAQEFFVNDEFETALFEALESLSVLPTADGHLLTGSILFMLYRDTEAAEHWEQALQIDPDSRFMVYPGFQQWLQQLK